MPFGDRRGPMSLGPRTGRGASYCSGFGTPGFANFITGRGCVRGFGWFGGGRGLRRKRNRFWAAGMPGWAGYGYPYAGWTSPYDTGLTAQEEMNMLRNQAEFLKRELDEIQDRISKIEKTQESENK